MGTTIRFPAGGRVAKLFKSWKNTAGGRPNDQLLTMGLEERRRINVCNINKLLYVLLMAWKMLL
jgi:hypothetical protein